MSLLFLRPWWLCALLLLPLWFWWQRHHQSGNRSWRQAVDAHLLPHLLARGGGGHGLRTLLPLLAATLGILALAGPSWRQSTTPLWQSEAPLVLALDLSSAMRTADLPPSRLAQAKARLHNLLEQRRGGQLGLLAYADDAFTVAPLTRDGQTLGALLDSLQPDIMPADGQRDDRAIEHAVQMLQAAGFVRGDILLVSDQASTAGQSAAARALAAGFRVSALGVGTAAGAPLANARGFVSGADGKLVLARLDSASLQALTRAGGGRYATLDNDGSDLRALDLLDAQGSASAMQATTSMDQQLRRSDDGYWLLLPMLLLMLPLFRRGITLVLLLGLCSTTLLPGRAQAQAQSAATIPADTVDSPTPAASGFGWWQRPDQRARAALDAGDAASARTLAQDPALQAAAAYRTGDYEAAAQLWNGLDQPDAHYNRGNALAHAGKYQEALAAYDQALATQPQLEDAIANRKAVADLLQQQQQQQQNRQQQQDQQQSGQDGQPQQQDGQQQDGSDAQSGQQDDAQQGGEPGEDPAGSTPPESGGTEQDSDGTQSSEPSTEADASEQAEQDQASAAMREQMQEHLQDQQQATQQAQTDATEAEQQEQHMPVLSAEERAQMEKEQALQQWLRRVPDDPGSLLRRKFARENQQRQSRPQPPGEQP